MPSDTPHPIVRPVVRLRGWSLHTLLAPIPFVCFLGTLVTDIVYAVTADMQWANFSAWMLVVGLAFSVLVVFAGLIDLVGDRRRRTSGAAWLHGVGDAVALALAVVNAFIHSRDAYSSVVPAGLMLSLLVVLILAGVGWLDRGLEDRP